MYPLVVGTILIIILVLFLSDRKNFSILKGSSTTFMQDSHPSVLTEGLYYDCMFKECQNLNDEYGFSVNDSEACKQRCYIKSLRREGDGLRTVPSGACDYMCWNKKGSEFYDCLDGCYGNNMGSLRFSGVDTCPCLNGRTGANTVIGCVCVNK